MKDALIKYMERGRNDEVYTPEYAVLPLLKYLYSTRYKTVWECTDMGGSNITKVLKEKEYDVIISHKEENFFVYEPEEYDVIITNPPYSIKTEFLERAYTLNKPFAFLMPLTTLETERRGKLFKENGLELIILDNRIDFTGKGNNWFNASWFCYNICESQLNFERIPSAKKRDDTHYRFKKNIEQYELF
jgi:hypothetical protein